MALVVAAVLLVGCEGDVAVRSGSGSSPTGQDSGTAHPPTPAPTAPRAGSVVPARPLTVRLPSGRRLSVRAVSTRHGLLDVPADVDRVGWWRGGSRIGDPFGATLLAAHVDSTDQGVGPFAELLGVRRGALVRISGRGLTQDFAVASLRLVPRRALARHVEVFSPRGPRRLTLVTCAGPYVPSRGGYLDLLVVTATPTTAAREKAAS